MNGKLALSLRRFIAYCLLPITYSCERMQIGNRQSAIGNFLFILLPLTLPFLPACSYTSKSLYNQSVHTVAVPNFSNNSFRRDWENKLSEAIKKNIEYRTPYKIAPESTADSVLTGKIVDIQENVLTRRYLTILPRETELTVIVDFTWKDLRSGRVIVQRKAFTRTSTEIPQIGERVDDAEQLAVERLAAAIVDQLQADW